MATLPDLATSADLTEYGYSADAASKLTQASTRVRRFLRQDITSGSSTTTLYGLGPWILPQRPVTEVTSFLNSDGVEVEFVLDGPVIEQDSIDCAPFTVTFSHGYLTVPDGLVELVCSIASRLASTPGAVAGGARTEQAGGEAVTWGVEAFVGTTGLTSEEKRELRKLFPSRPRSVRLL